MSDVQAAEWTRDPRLVPIVNLIKRSMRNEEQQVVDRTDCFGLFVIEGEGECSEAPKCALAAHCRTAYDMARAAGGIIIQPVPQTTDPRAPEPPAAYAKPLKNRWATTGKYMRRGYEDLGRPVDLFLAEFRRTIGELPQMPPVWHASNYATQFSHRGQYQAASTASYHTVMRDGVIIVRFWTNAAKQALVDIPPELVDPLIRVSDRLGQFRYNTREVLQLEAPVKIPDKCWPKTRPCTHRVVVRTQLAAYETAKAVRTHWKF